MALKPKPPPIRKPPDLPNAFGSPPRGFAGPLIEELRLDGFDFGPASIPELDIRACLIERVSLANRTIQRLRIRDTRFVNCDLSNATLRGFEAARVEFTGCRLIGLKAIECRFRDVLIEECDVRYGQFTDGRLAVCEIKTCGLQEADFRGANLEGIRMERVNLSRANLNGAKLKDADLRGAEIEGVIVRAEDVKGAIVSPPQAMDLARLLGLAIR